MGLEELQSHRMPQRERNERQEGNKQRNCNIKLACPARMVAKPDSTRALFGSEILCHWAENTGQRLTVLLAEMKEWGWI